jgi:phosphatidate phosphatase PAH1
MRSLSLYKFSKSYIKTYIKIEGALLTEPEQFFTAFKKEITKCTGNVKANMMRAIRNIFPQHIDPFIGGLGNREQDAVAYRAVGVPYKNIYIVDKTSKVQRMNSTKTPITYQHLSDNFSDAFLPHL